MDSLKVLSALVYNKKTVIFNDTVFKEHFMKITA
jgi:hypothetical protein